jgi:hypothetical protein
MLDENGAAFFAGEQTGVITDLVGTVMVIDLGNDQITLDFDLFRAPWLCFLDNSDDSNLGLAGMIAASVQYMRRTSSG